MAAIAVLAASASAPGLSTVPVPSSICTPFPPHWAVTGQATGTSRPSCVKRAETSPTSSTRSCAVPSALISSTHGRVSAASHATRSAVVGFEPTRPAPGLMPSIVQPV